MDIDPVMFHTFPFGGVGGGGGVGGDYDAHCCRIPAYNPPSANLIPVGFGSAYLRGVVVPV